MIERRKLSRLLRFSLWPLAFGMLSHIARVVHSIRRHILEAVCN